MQGIDRSKKWGLARAACVLLLVIAPIHHLFAEEGARPYSSLPASGEPEKKDHPEAGAIAKSETLTLSRSIEIALEKNPAILAARYGVDVNASRVGEARSGYYPQLSASAAYTRINPVPILPATTNPSRSFDQYSSTVTLNQNILDFGKTSSQIDVSKYNLEASRGDLDSTQDTVILSVKQAYYGVLQARRNRDVAADVIKQFELHLDQAKGFYDVGTKARIDVIKAEVDLSNAKLNLINAENAFKISWVTLKNAMGVPDAPEGTYTIEEKLTFEKYTITQEEASMRALEKRPDYKSISARRQAAETNISLARSGYYPVLSGNASYNWVAENKTSPLEEGWSAGVVLTVPLFSGFLTSHQVAEAKSNLYILKANEESLRQQIMFEVRQAYLNLQAAEASIATARLAAEQAKENLDLANGRYAAGVGSPVEVSDAFATYVAAQASYTNALSNYRIARANIEKSMGAR
jgi:outer membrane protein